MSNLDLSDSRPFLGLIDCRRTPDGGLVRHRTDPALFASIDEVNAVHEHELLAFLRDWFTSHRFAPAWATLVDSAVVRDYAFGQVKVAMLSTSAIQTASVVEPGTFFTTGRLERAIKAGLEVHVCSSRRELLPHDNWWIELLVKSGGRTWTATEAPPLPLKTYRSAHRALLGESGFDPDHAHAHACFCTHVGFFYEVMPLEEALVASEGSINGYTRLIEAHGVHTLRTLKRTA